MKPHYFFSSVTRNSDLWLTPFKTLMLDRSDWNTGDFVVGRTTGKRNRLYECETKTGRMADMVRGDLLIGALGERAATLEGVGDWRAVAENLELEALTSAGLLGRATSISPMLPDLMRLEYLGHVTRDGNKVGMMDFVVPVKPMDILKFGDAGASAVFDFVDAGLPSTVCPESTFRQALELLLSKVAACNADVLVAEAGASPLEPYNGATVVDYLGDLTRFTVLCASDPYAVLGVQTAYGAHMTADLVSGPAANTTAATRLVRELSGHRALNLLDRNTYPELVALLKKALSLA
jgi:hypothetical protein